MLLLLYTDGGAELLQIYLEHLLDVVVFGLEQLAPGGQVAVGQDPTGLQQPVSVTLPPGTQHNT